MKLGARQSARCVPRPNDARAFPSAKDRRSSTAGQVVHRSKSGPAMSELVKTGKAQNEQMFSGLPPNADSDLRGSAPTGKLLRDVRALRTSLQPTRPSVGRLLLHDHRPLQKASQKHL